MNSYQNKNEYEILDTSRNSSNMSNRYPRYPLANDPQASMQNTNYKDWLNMCDSNSQFVGDISTYSSPEAALSVRDAVLTGINTAGTILSNLGVPLASQSFGIISRLIGILWPGPDPFAALIVLVEELIDRRITDRVRDAALIELKGLKGIMELYQTRLKTWLDCKNTVGCNNEKNREVLVQQYRIVDNFFVQNMPKFSETNFEILLLPVYAQAANMHLMLLRDADYFSAEWQLGPDEIRDNYIRLQGLIRQYKDHCVTFYNQGLNQFNRSNAQEWVRFNRFRTDMTLTVLDLAILFPNYDPRRYPLAVKTELTREIYTDPVGYINNSELGGGVNLPWYNPNNTTFATMENSAIRPPSYTTWLNRIFVYTRNLGNMSGVRNVWGGHALVENGNDGSEITHNFGNTNESITPIQYFDFRNVSVFSIDSLAHVWILGSAGSNFIDNMYGVSRVTFHTSNVNNVPGSLRYEVPNDITYNSQTILSELPGENVQRPNARDFSHRLSYISYFNANRGSSLGNVYLLTYGWTHISMDRNNRLEPDKITQIDAVKGFGDNLVIPGPTGGNLVRLSDRGDRGYSLRVQAPEISTSYRIRLRYACLATFGDAIFVEHSGSRHIVSFFDCSNAPGRPSNTLLESDFRYIDVPGIFTPSINPEIRFISRSFDGPNALDKIEFIPLNTFANQSLEKREKAVNDLFIN
ncbi:pesticidal crystal protein [Bacillus sp. ISL-8]|nr:pesticidal crystal protein [Bacillus sp. ISL-8]